MNTTYNGWTNYATWRINLEIFDGNEYITELASQCEDVYKFSETLKQYVLDYLWENCTEPTIQGWANGFVSDCNFYEIATHYAELIKQQKNN